MKEQRLILIGVLLLSITGFTVFQHILLLKERSGLLNSLKQAKEEITALKNEKQKLLQDLEKQNLSQQQISEKNLELQAHLQASKERLSKLFAQLAQAEERIQALDSRDSVFKLENNNLKKEKDILHKQLRQAWQENADLREQLIFLAQEIQKLNSNLPAAKGQDLSSGNRGFLTKEGKPTPRSKITVEVMPGGINSE